MSTKVYVYGLCNVFYDGYYILGIKELYKKYKFNISKFPDLGQGVFAFIVEEDDSEMKVIIDSNDSNQIDLKALDWCNVYGKVNYNLESLIAVNNKDKIIPIGPSFGIKIWNLFQTFYHLTFNYIRYKKKILNKKVFIANYWRQFKRLRLKDYTLEQSSNNKVFFVSSIWKKEEKTNANRALFMESCMNNPDISFEGGFTARSDGDNLGYDNLIYPKMVPLKLYLKKVKKSVFVFNTPAVLSCHGWKLAEFLALGKAIISTPHNNKLSADLLSDTHMVYVKNRLEMDEVIKKITSDVSFKTKLELESKKYFDEYLAPNKVINRLLKVK